MHGGSGFKDLPLGDRLARFGPPVAQGRVARQTGRSSQRCGAGLAPQTVVFCSPDQEGRNVRVVIQRVAHARVEIHEDTVSAIGPGLLLLVGVEPDDTDDDIEWLVRKIVPMRIFEDGDGRMNLSVQDVGGQILVVSQFTLHASTRKGNRPSFTGAARPEVAIPLFERFVDAVQATVGRPVATGQFGARMKVSLLNDGPVTLLIDSKRRE